MGGILDKLDEWLRGLLIEGITGNLSGMFDTVNTKVGEIAGEVGQTPLAWNSGVFSMIRNLSETVIVPIAGVILTFVMCYELIQLVTEKNNLLKNTAIKNISIDFLECLTFEDINEYQRYLRFNSSVDGSSHQNQDKAIARRMAALRGLFEFLCLHQYMKNNPTVGAAKRIKMPQKDIIRLNDEEVNTFLNVVSNTNIKGNKLQIEKCKKTQLRDTALITLLLNTGIRVSECAGLDIDDINFNYRTINIVRKGGSDAHLYFNEATKKALKDYIENERPLLLGNTESDEQAVFISMKKSRMSISAIERMVKKYAKNATPDKKISPHKMRSTYGTALYKDTGDIRLVSDVLGHKDINTTAKHYAAMEEEHRKLAATIPLYQEKKEEE